MSVLELTSETATEILNKTLDELQCPNNMQKLEEAKDNVGNEMLKMMQFLFPIVMQIQMDVIKDYGYPEGRDGIIKFSQMLRNLEREDPEVARLHSLIKSYYLPPVSVHTTNESPAEEKVNIKMETVDIQAMESKLSDVTVTAIPAISQRTNQIQTVTSTNNNNNNKQQDPGQSKYAQLLAVIEEMGREVRPTYAGSRSSAERLKRNIVSARILVRECLMETERSARQ